MTDVKLKREGGIAYREARPSQDSGLSPVLCVHGWPQSSYMWRHLLRELAATGADPVEQTHALTRQVLADLQRALADDTRLVIVTRVDDLPGRAAPRGRGT